MIDGAVSVYILLTVLVFTLLSVVVNWLRMVLFFFFFQAEDGIRDLVRSRGLGDVYKRQGEVNAAQTLVRSLLNENPDYQVIFTCTTPTGSAPVSYTHLTLPTNREV